MKFKFKPEKSNLFLMTSIIFLLFITCIFWLIIKEYIFFSVYIMLTVIIAHIYYFTSYFIEAKYFVTKLGFIKIKIKYSDIRKIEDMQEKVKISLKSFSFYVYPRNKDIFVAKLNSKIDKQKFA
ncbi:MAG: hypothetical protein E7161_02325 [Firmicutes bacterium]|nr:hypothetical protein [Bacillota bacterium]